jgi:DNA-binding MarR family transcriptional regulator
MARRDPQVDELRRALRQVLRGLWRRPRPPDDLMRLLHGEPRIGRRHVALLVHAGTEGPSTVGELAEGIGVSLPAASRLARDLEIHGLVRRREAEDDKRRTVVDLDPEAAGEIQAWLARRDEPLRNALAALDPNEREAFLKGLRALADELVRESADRPLRPHHRQTRRRGPDRHRSV